MLGGHEGLRVLRSVLTAIVHCNDAMTVKEKWEVWVLLLILLYNKQITNKRFGVGTVQNSRL